MIWVMLGLALLNCCSLAVSIWAYLYIRGLRMDCDRWVRMAREAAQRAEASALCARVAADLAAELRAARRAGYLP